MKLYPVCSYLWLGYVKLTFQNAKRYTDAGGREGGVNLESICSGLKHIEVKLDRLIKKNVRERKRARKRKRERERERGERLRYFGKRPRSTWCA